MAISDNGTRDQYVAAAAQTIFQYTFEIFDKDDIAVEQNGTLLAEGTNYTVSGVGADAGGNITLIVGATSGDVITLYRAMVLDRVTDYQQNGDFLADEVNDDFDRLWAAMQQVFGNSNIGIRPTVDDPILNSTNTELANVATRGGKVLGFASNGTLDYLSGVIAGGDFTDVTTTTAMVNIASPSVGDVVQTAEFSTGNGGGGTYDVVLTSSVVTNGFNIIVGVADPFISFVLREDERWLDIRTLGTLGVGNDTEIIQAAVDRGSILVPVDVSTTDRILVTRDNTTIFIAENVTWNLTGYIYNGTQSPFGNLINITADRCSVIGGGDSSLLQLGVTDGNAIGYLHCDEGLVANLKIDGNKANNPAVTDDIFQSGIVIVNTAAGNPGGIGKYTITGVDVSNFSQYGINVFGEQVIEFTVHDCRSYDHGRAGDAESVGAGLVMTFGISHVSVTDSYFFGNKTRGIFQSSAGEDAEDYTITGNHCYNNGTHGIAFTEEALLGSDPGNGTKNVTITGNIVTGNGQQGILIGTFDDVGFMKDLTVTGNICNNNTAFGILIQTNDDPTDRTSNITVTGNTTNNNDTGIGIGSNIDFTVLVDNNVSEGNTTANYGNFGAPSGLATAFTPTVVGSTLAGEATYSTATGTYVRRGNKIEYSFIVDYNTFTGTGNMAIGGFPFAASLVEPASITSGWANGLALTGTLMLRTTAGSTEINLDAINNGAFASVAVDAAATIRASGFYRIDR